MILKIIGSHYHLSVTEQDSLKKAGIEFGELLARDEIEVIVGAILVSIA